MKSWQLNFFNSSKIIAAVILYLKLITNLFVVIPENFIAYYSVFLLSGAALLIDGYHIILLIIFVLVYGIHVAINSIYVFHKKRSHRVVFGGITCFLLIVDIAVYLFVTPFSQSLIAVCIDIVCILFIILSCSIKDK